MSAEDRIAELEAVVKQLSDEVARLSAAAEPQDAEPVLKFNDEKRLVMGWSYVQRRPNGEVVVDHSGDVLRDPSSLEDAVYDFVVKSRVANVDHAGPQVATLVESLWLDEQKLQAMGLTGPSPTAWWTGFKVHDDKTWDEVKNGKRIAFSVEGRGKRRPL